MSFFDELKRRSVFRVAIGYIGASWLVLQVIDVLFGIFDYETDIDETIVIILAVGFIPAMILAWVFELTPDGIKRDAEANRDTPGMHSLGRRLDRAAMVVLALAVGFFAFDKFVLDPARDASRELAAEQRGRTQAIISGYGTKSIAVMPFENMSPDPEQEYFADGISEELLNMLVRIQDLRVISRTSSFALRDEGLSIPEIGQRLKVAHVLEGSVRKSGNSIRITAQLIEAHTDTHLWSQTYDRKLNDIFDIQDEIAQLVVDGLKAQLLGEIPKSLRTDPLVLTLVMQARRAGGYGGDGEHRALELYEEAVQIDPNYVPALLQLGTVHYQIAANAWPFDIAAFEQASALANSYFDRAVAIDPNNPQVYFWRAWDAYEKERDFQKSADLMERAIAVEPGNQEILAWSSELARRLGKFDASLQLKRLAAERNPECHRCNNIWLTYLDAKRYDEAIAARLAVDNQYISNYAVVMGALMKGDAELALQYSQPDLVNPNYLHAFRAMALYSLGRVDEAQAEFEIQVREWSEKDQIPTAMATLWFGDEAGALDLLYDRFWPHMAGFYQEIYRQVWQPLYDHPRWIALSEKSGWTDEAFANVRFNPQIPGFSAGDL